MKLLNIFFFYYISFSLTLGQEINEKAKADSVEKAFPSPQFDPDSLNYYETSNLDSKNSQAKDTKENLLSPNEALADSINHEDDSGLEYTTQKTGYQSSTLPVSSYETTESVYTSSELYSSIDLYSTTEVPYSSTEVPYSSTEVPYSSTEVPYSSTEVPYSSTEVPSYTTVPTYSSTPCCQSPIRLLCCRVRIENRPPTFPKFFPDWKLLKKTLKSAFLMPFKVGLNSAMYGAAIPAAAASKGAAVSSSLAAPVILASVANAPAVSSMVAGKFALPALLFGNSLNNPSYSKEKNREMDEYLISEGIVTKRASGSDDSYLSQNLGPVRNFISQNLDTANDYLKKNLGQVVNNNLLKTFMRQNLDANDIYLVNPSDNVFANALTTARDFMHTNLHLASSALSQTINPVNIVSKPAQSLSKKFVEN